MTIEEAGVVLHQNIQGSCYVSDKYGNLIGWYDYNSKVLYLDDRYKYADKLLEKCEKATFQIIYSNIEEDEVLKYFAQRRIKVRDYLIKKKQEMKWINENMKYLPSKKQIKKVKNAESKIKKRHG